MSVAAWIRRNDHSNSWRIGARSMFGCRLAYKSEPTVEFASLNAVRHASRLRRRYRSKWTANPVDCCHQSLSSVAAVRPTWYRNRNSEIQQTRSTHSTGIEKRKLLHTSLFQSCLQFCSIAGQALSHFLRSLNGCRRRLGFEVLAAERLMVDCRKCNSQLFTTVYTDMLSTAASRFEFRWSMMRVKSHGFNFLNRMWKSSASRVAKTKTFAQFAQERCIIWYSIVVVFLSSGLVKTTSQLCSECGWRSVRDALIRLDYCSETFSFANAVALHCFGRWYETAVRRRCIMFLFLGHRVLPTGWFRFIFAASAWPIMKRSTTRRTASVRPVCIANDFQCQS